MTSPAFISRTTHPCGHRAGIRRCIVITPQRHGRLKWPVMRGAITPFGSLSIGRKALEAVV